MLQRGSDAGRVYDDCSIDQDISWVKQLDSLNPEAIFGIGLLSDEAKQDIVNRAGRLRIEFFSSAFAFEMDDDKRLAPPSNKGRDGGQRNDAGG